MYRSRTIERPWLDASRQFPALILTGPRQTGKTTVLRHLCEADRRYVTLDDPGARLQAAQDPQLFLQRYPPPVLIDEIQYAPALLPYIKIAIDAARRPGMFWLTGSQQFHLMKGVSETLAGRLALVDLLGFSTRERLGRPTDLDPFLPTRDGLARREATAVATVAADVDDHIWRGSFPPLLVDPAADRDLFYVSYVRTYLLRDVRDLAQVGNESAFLRFLKACAARTAQLLNLSDLARDVDVSVNTARSWLSILEASRQVLLLQPFSTNLSRRLVKRPKLYFLDTGLCAHLTEWSSPATLGAGAMAGAIFETHVVVEILKSWWHRLRTPRLYYFRDRDGREVDLVIEQDGVLYPIEIKRAVTPRREWAAPIERFRRLGPPAGPGSVVCLADQVVPLTDTVTSVPVGLL